MRELRVIVAFLCAPALSQAQPRETLEPNADPTAAGTVEVGGAAGVLVARDVRVVSLSGSAGWFFSDGFALTSIVGLSSIAVDDADKTLVTAFVAPTYHVPVSRFVNAFAGLGLGAAYVDDGSGLAIAPRIGAKLRVSNAGLLTGALSYQHVFNNLDDEMVDPALDAALSSTRIEIGYATFW